MVSGNDKSDTTTVLFTEKTQSQVVKERDVYIKKFHLMDSYLYGASKCQAANKGPSYRCFLMYRSPAFSTLQMKLNIIFELCK